SRAVAKRPKSSTKSNSQQSADKPQKRHRGNRKDSKESKQPCAKQGPRRRNTEAMVVNEPENQVAIRPKPKSNEKRVPMRWLPFDVYYLIFALNFQLADLFRYRRVCRAWNQAIEEIFANMRSLHIFLGIGWSSTL